MTIGRVVSWLGLASAFLFVISIAAFAETTSILNASYDVSRELYKDINPAFVAAWKKSSGADIEVKQAHGGSTKQAQAVAEGLEADVVTLNQPTDLDFLVTKGVVSSDWRKKFPDGAAPYTTTSIFLVRKGNPKGIKDWDDLAKPGVSVVIPNPKTSGNGRYTYLAAWGYALDKFGSADKARDFDFLFSDAAQEIIAKHHFRPRSEAVRKATAARFPEIHAFSVEEKLGPWAELQKTHSWEVRPLRALNLVADFSRPRS